MQKIDISTSTFVRLGLFIFSVWFVFLIRDVLVLLFFVLIIVAGLSPTVDRWARYITRPGAVVSVFLIIFAVIGLIFSLLVPPFIVQLQDFTNNLPEIAAKLADSSSDPGFIQSLTNFLGKNLGGLSSQLSNIGEILFSRTIGVISGLVAFITILVLAFYLLVEEEGLKKIYRGLLPADWHDGLSETTRKISVKLGAWLRGQLILMLVVGAAVTLGMLLIGSEYALTLGIWSGVTEVIPIVGPLIGAVPGVALGLTVSPLQGFLALLVYTVIQQLENNVLVPRVMAKAVGLNPVVVILAIVVGGKLYGLTGVFLAVPLAAVLGVLAEDWEVIRQTFTRKS